MQSLYPDSVLMVAAIGLQNCPTPIWLSLYQGYMIYYVFQGIYVVFSFSVIIIVQFFLFVYNFFFTHHNSIDFYDKTYKNKTESINHDHWKKN